MCTYALTSLRCRPCSGLGQQKLQQLYQAVGLQLCQQDGLSTGQSNEVGKEGTDKLRAGSHVAWLEKVTSSSQAAGGCRGTGQGIEAAEQVLRSARPWLQSSKRETCDEIHLLKLFFTCIVVASVVRPKGRCQPNACQNVGDQRLCFLRHEILERLEQLSCSTSKRLQEYQTDVSRFCLQVRQKPCCQLPLASNFTGADHGTDACRVAR